MKKVQIFTGLLTSAVLFNACQKDIVNPQDKAGYGECPRESQKMIVVFKEDAFSTSFKNEQSYELRVETMRKEIKPFLADYGVAETMIENVYAKALKGFAGNLDAATVKKMKMDDRVAYIEEDQMVVLGPPPGKGKPGDGGDGGDGGSDPAQETPWGTTRVGGAADGTGKTAWIIDSGIDLDHPDLNVDAGRSRTFVSTGKDSKNANDGNGHGTHVAGTIGAIDNNIGVVGVAANATVVAVKVLNSRGSGSYADVIAGVDYVASAGAAGDVANMSLGGPASQAVDDAVVNAASTGVIFTLAAGNESDDANNHSPARANGANIYTISAMDNSDVFAYFSNYGNPPVDYCAPGVAINSTWKNGGYNSISGTSMAAPHAAGVLLVTGGTPNTSGTVIGDPDGTPDAIISQ